MNEWRPDQSTATGAANAWAVMSVDTDRGLVYVPTGSASPDFYGGTRHGSNRYANSLLAIDAATGKLIWHQQLVHHDLWNFGATTDSYFRAFDIDTGREVWKRRLPAGGQATPMTYRAGADHRQYVLIAAGGHGGLGTPRGDYVVAFALPEKLISSAKK